MLCGPLAADVIVFDGSGGPFVTLGSVVLGARDGDTVVVRPGAWSYGPFTISGKSLTVVADGAVQLSGTSTQGPGSNTIVVQNLGPAQRVVVRGFRSDFGATVRDCAGAVWLDELVCTGGGSICTSGRTPGLSVERSAAVTVTRSSFVGESPWPDGFGRPVASPGLSAVGAGLTLFDCTLTGGAGLGTNALSAPTPGAAGAFLDGSTLTLSGCAIVGGPGGVDVFGLCAGVHAPGGPGVLFSGSPSTIRSVESTAAGGAASLEPFCPGQSGPAGPAIVGAGTIVPLPGYARHLRASGPVRGGEDLVLAVEGRPGEVPWILVSPEHAPVWLAGHAGTLLVGLPPEELFVLPVLPASGLGTLTLPVPNVGLAIGALTYHLQAIFLDPAPRVWLGAGTTVSLLDASY